jgi:hypothetical protein
MPLIVAPCFPAYPSAHGTLSTAGQEVLERLHGPSGHDITFTTAAMPGMTLHYTAFKPLVDDISDARVYGGIHFRFDQDGGERQGTAIGKYVFKHNLRPVHPELRALTDQRPHSGGRKSPSSVGMSSDTVG